LQGGKKKKQDKDKLELWDEEQEDNKQNKELCYKYRPPMKGYSKEGSSL